MKKNDTTSGLVLNGPLAAEHSEILTPAALEFLSSLHREFNPRRMDLLRERSLRRKAIQGGKMPHFLDETRELREGKWRVLPVPDDLQKRRVEITGPVERRAAGPGECARCGARHR